MAIINTCIKRHPIKQHSLMNHTNVRGKPPKFMLHTTRGCCNSSQTRCTLCVQEANLLQFLHDTKIPKTRGARASGSARVEWNYLFINLSFHPTRNRPSFRASVRGRLWCIQFGCFFFFSFLLSREVYFQNQKWKLYYFFAAFYSDTEFFFLGECVFEEMRFYGSNVE